MFCGYTSGSCMSILFVERKVCVCVCACACEYEGFCNFLPEEYSLAIMIQKLVTWNLDKEYMHVLLFGSL